MTFNDEIHWCNKLQNLNNGQKEREHQIKTNNGYKDMNGKDWERRPEFPCLQTALQSTRQCWI